MTIDIRQYLNKLTQIVNEADDNTIVITGGKPEGLLLKSDLKYSKRILQNTHNAAVNAMNAAKEYWPENIKSTEDFNYPMIRFTQLFLDILNATIANAQSANDIDTVKNLQKSNDTILTVAETGVIPNDDMPEELNTQFSYLLGDDYQNLPSDELKDKVEDQLRLYDLPSLAGTEPTEQMESDKELLEKLAASLNDPNFDGLDWNEITTTLDGTEDNSTTDDPSQSQEPVRIDPNDADQEPADQSGPDPEDDLYSDDEGDFIPGSTSPVDDFDDEDEGFTNRPDVFDTPGQSSEPSKPADQSGPDPEDDLYGNDEGDFSPSSTSPVDDFDDEDEGFTNRPDVFDTPSSSDSGSNKPADQSVPSYDVDADQDFLGDPEVGPMGGTAGTGRGSGSSEVSRRAADSSTGTGRGSGAGEVSRRAADSSTGTGRGSGAGEVSRRAADSSTGTGRGDGSGETTRRSSKNLEDFMWQTEFGLANNPEAKEAIKELQTLLNIPADGVYGPATVQAVKDYQTKNGLTADGDAGSQTISHILGLQARKSDERGKKDYTTRDKSKVTTSSQTNWDVERVVGNKGTTTNINLSKHRDKSPYVISKFNGSRGKVGKIYGNRKNLEKFFPNTTIYPASSNESKDLNVETIDIWTEIKKLG